LALQDCEDRRLAPQAVTQSSAATGSPWLGSSGLRRQKAGSSGRNTELSGN
jgi:hypothetical protein